jgi:hypothetical protein
MYAPGNRRIFVRMRQEIKIVDDIDKRIGVGALEENARRVARAHDRILDVLPAGDPRLAYAFVVPFKDCHHFLFLLR